jgi:ZIP family zinc transporter
MPIALRAGLWGLLGGAALLVGAAIGWFARLPQRLVAGIMALGAGVFISAPSFELVDEAWGRAGKSLGQVLGLWTAIAAASGIAAWTGYLAFAGAAPGVVAFVQSLAAGAILAMVVDTMIPEAFESTHELSGLISVAGFLVAFMLSKLAG